MSRTRRLLTSSLIVIALSALNKIMGFVRIFVVSGRFGTSDEFDAFTAANQLPELFYVIVSGGALAAALIPVYVDYLKSEDPEKARQSGDLLSTVVTLMMVVLGLICGIAAIFAPQVTNAFVPDFDPAKQALTADLMRIILLNTAIIGLSGAIAGALHAHQHFVLPALSPTMFDVGYFLGFFLLVPTMGIFGLAWGTVIGSSLHLLVQLPALYQHRIKIFPRLATSIAGVGEIGRLMVPRLFTVGAIQASDLFLLRFSSGLPEGAVSGYFYAYTLLQLPETLFGTTIALVVFPTLAEYFNQNRLSDLKTTASNALRIIWLLTIPSAIGLILLGRPAIAFVLERGAFDADSTTLVYRALVFLAFRVVAEATLEIVARLFYAQHNTLTPMYCYIV